MKRFFAFLLIGALLFTACAAQTANAEKQPATAAPASTQAAASQESTPTAALTDPTDAARETTDAFSITTDNGAVSASGSVYTITAAGEYTIGGALSDGQIVVDAGEEDEVKLLLNNASITCTTDAPILVKNAGEITVKAEKNTYNTVSDLRTGDASAAGEENYDAAIYAACDLKLTGSGTLIVTSTYDNGVKSKDDLSVKNMTLKVTAVGNALKGNDSVEIKSGALMLTSTASDGIKTENTDVSSKGNQRGTVTISGGQVDIYAACDAIHAAYNVEISDEESCIVNLYTASYASESTAAAGTEQYLIVPSSLYSEDYDYYVYLYNEDDAAGAWVKCTYDTMVYSGRTAYYGLAYRTTGSYQNLLWNLVPAGTAPDGTNYVAASTGETVNGSMNAYLITSISSGVIAGDWVQLSSGSGNSNKTTYSAKGIKAANEIFITGGTISVYAMDDGLHANGGDALENGAAGLGNVTISGGTLSITSADDGIHADGALTIDDGTVAVVNSHEGLEGNVITINGGTISVYGDDDGINACSGSATPLLTINGGSLTVTTPSGDTDAIDSNGNFSMTGGAVLVRGGTQMGNMAGSVDVDGSITVSGGTIAAFGGICQIPSNGSVNTYVSNGTSFAAGDYQLKDASGNVLFSFTLDTGYSSCWIASEAFALGSSYTLEKDGTIVLNWTQSSNTEGATGNYGGFGGKGGFGGHGGWGGRR